MSVLAAGKGFARVAARRHYSGIMRTAAAPWLAVAALLAGCASLVPPQPPDVRLAGLAVERLGLFEQRYRLTLRLDNPNDRALEVEELRFDLRIAGRELARGVGAGAFRVPANGSGRAEVDVTSDLAAVLDVVGPWLRGDGGALDYRITGEVVLAGWARPLPFEETGRLAPP